MYKQNSVIEVLICNFLQAGSGNDLAMLMIDCFNESNQGIDDDKLQKIKSIFELYSALDSSDRQEFAMKALG